MLLTHVSALWPDGFTCLAWAELEEVGGASPLDPSLMEVWVRLTEEQEVWAWATPITRI